MFCIVYKLTKKLTKNINKNTFILRKNYRRLDYRLHIYPIGRLGKPEDLLIQLSFLLLKNLHLSWEQHYSLMVSSPYNDERKSYIGT